MQKTPKTEILTLPRDIDENRRLPVAYMTVEKAVTSEVVDAITMEAERLSVPVSEVKRHGDGIAVHIDEMTWPEDAELLDLASRVRERVGVTVERVEQQHNIGRKVD